MSRQSDGSRSGVRSGNQAAGLILLCLLVLFAQSTSLIHTHDGDLQRHHDCEVCIKFGSDDEAFTVAGAVSPERPAAGPVVESGDQFIPLSFLAPRSRAPPLS